MHDFSLGGSLGDWLVHIMGPAHLALQLGTVSPISVECVSKEPLNKWLWPWRAHTIIEFPQRGSMPPVKVHLHQNIRGDFQNPSGMAENEPLLPRRSCGRSTRLFLQVPKRNLWPPARRPLSTRMPWPVCRRSRPR